MSDYSKSFDDLVENWKQNKKEEIYSPASESEAFHIMQTSNRYFIEPTFTIEEKSKGFPKIILISAVGASGKSTLAKELSFRTHSILLDLAVHDAVGSNSLTGLIASAYPPEKILDVFDSLRKGEMGIIIDGADEGKAKTAPNAFFAFLDDIAKMCESAPQGASFIVLGRSNVMEDCFIYLDCKNINVELWQLDPFSKEQAQIYIDKHQTNGAGNECYRNVCHLILNGLEKSLQQSDNDQDEVLRFMGYAPVLDTISEIIEIENRSNLYAFYNELQKEEFQNDRILCDILEYLLKREKGKIDTGFVKPRSSFFAGTDGKEIEKSIYSPLEQARRLISLCEGKVCRIGNFKDEALQEEYDHFLNENGFLSEHPFLKNTQFRNQVFESYILAKLLLAQDEKAKNEACSYLMGKVPSYYLIVFMLQCNPGNGVIALPVAFLPCLLQATMGMKTRKTFVEIEIDESETAGVIDVGIDISSFPMDQGDGRNSKNEMQHRHTLKIEMSVDAEEKIELGNVLENVSVYLPNYKLSIGERGSLLVLSPFVDIEAKSLELSAKKVEISNSGVDNVISINAPEVIVALEDRDNISNLDRLQIVTRTGLGYPFFKCQKDFLIPHDDIKMEHVLRLRKILMLFRSRSQGNMARFCDKIEHRRVLKGEWEKKLLNQLLEDSILEKEGSMYYISPEKIDEMLEVNWEQLRNGVFSNKFIQYVNKI
jgi:hypothetical protein